MQLSVRREEKKREKRRLCECPLFFFVRPSREPAVRLLPCAPEEHSKIDKNFKLVRSAVVENKTPERFVYFLGVPAHVPGRAGALVVLRWGSDRKRETEQQAGTIGFRVRALFAFFVACGQRPRKENREPHAPYTVKTITTHTRNQKKHSRGAVDSRGRATGKARAIQ